MFCQCWPSGWMLQCKKSIWIPLFVILAPQVPTTITEAKSGRIYFNLVFLYANQHILHAASSKPIRCLTCQPMEFTQKNNSKICDHSFRSYMRILINKHLFPVSFMCHLIISKSCQFWVSLKQFPKLEVDKNPTAETQLRNDVCYFNDFHLVLLQLNFTICNFWI